MASPIVCYRGEGRDSAYLIVDDRGREQLELVHGLNDYLDDNRLMLRVVRDQDVGFSGGVARDEETVASLLNRGELDCVEVLV
jgi:hypothetical protein